MKYIHNNQFVWGSQVAGRTLQRVREAVMPVDPALWSALVALADPVRLRIILMLREREQCVCHLTEVLELSQGTISHHMSILKRAGLVRDRRDPDDTRWVYYALDESSVAYLQESLRSLLDTSHMDRTPASCRGQGRQ